MISARILSNRLIRFKSSNLILRNPFCTTTKMSKEFVEEFKKNPYFEKYSDKIAKLQKSSPEEYIQKLKDLEDQRKTPSTSAGANQPKEKEFSLPTEAKPNLNTGMLKEKKLDSIMKTDLLNDKSTEEISEIWKEYHKNKNGISAVIPKESYLKMKENMEKFKTFLLPLPRKEGYEFIVMQCEGNEIHLTTLINFQAHKENAPECLTIVHYPELMEDKGIVLMVGEFDKNNLTIPEAQCLANQIELYYCNPSKEKLSILETFTYRPNEFKHNILIEQIENISLLTK